MLEILFGFLILILLLVIFWITGFVASMFSKGVRRSGSKILSGILIWMTIGAVISVSYVLGGIFLNLIK